MVSHFDFDDISKLWPQPDMSVLRQGRRDPPEFPIEVFGPFWSGWLAVAAAGASAPIDYTASALMACAATYRACAMGFAVGRLERAAGRLDRERRRSVFQQEPGRRSADQNRSSA